MSSVFKWLLGLCIVVCFLIQLIEMAPTSSNESDESVERKLNQKFKNFGSKMQDAIANEMLNFKDAYEMEEIENAKYPEKYHFNNFVDTFNLKAKERLGSI